MKSNPIFIAMFTVLMISVGQALADDHKTTETLAEGKWTKKNYSAQGKWKIVKENGKLYVELDKSFKTQSAPDLKIFLHKKKAKDVKNSNATSGSLKVAKLKSNKGKQRYEIKTGTKIEDYKSIIIHCERFSKLWVAADLPEDDSN